MHARSSNISIIFIVNSKIALVFKLNLIANCVFHLDPLCGFRSVELGAFQAVCVTTHRGSWVKLLLRLISIVTRSSSHLVREMNQT